jgi:hypothetical protein
MKYKMIGCLIAFLLSGVWIHAQNQIANPRFDARGKLIVLDKNTTYDDKVIVPMNILLEEQTDVRDAINKKWKQFLDSVNAKCINCITGANIENLIQDKLAYNSQNISTDTESRTFLLKISPENEGKEDIVLKTEYQYTTDSHVRDVKFELRVKNLVYEQLKTIRGTLLNKLKELYVTQKNFKTIADNFEAKSHFYLQQMLDGNLDFFDCCDKKNYDLSEIKALFDCVKDGKKIALNEDLLKFYFIENLLKGNEFRDTRRRDLERRKMALEKQINSIETVIIRLLEDKISIATNTQAAKSIQLKIAANDSLSIRLRKELEAINKQIRELPAPKKNNYVWSDYLLLHTASLRIVVTPDKHNKHTQIRMFDYSNDLLGLHEPIAKKTYYNEASSFLVSVMNMDRKLSIDTVMGKVKEEQPLLVDGLGKIPGLKEMLGYISGWSVPTILSVVQGSIQKGINQPGFVDPGRMGAEEHDIAETDDDDELCCCCKVICKQTASVCINGENYKVPMKIFQKNDWLSQGLCLDGDALLAVQVKSFLYDYLIVHTDNTPTWVSVEVSFKAAYYSSTESFGLSKAGATDVKFVLQDEKGKTEKTLEEISVSRLYRITTAVGGGYQIGNPYELKLNASTNLFEKSYLNRLVLTGGFKFHFVKTSLREELVFRNRAYKTGSTKRTYTNIRRSNIASKCYLYLGVTLSNKPYEHVFVGAGLELYPGFSIMVAQRFSWIHRYRVESGSLIETSGYSRIFAPGSIGLSVLIDPRVAKIIF